MLQPLSSNQWNFEMAAHLLNRAGFGGTPSEIEKLADLDQDQAVSYLIDYENIPDPTFNPDWAKPNPEEVAKIRQINQTGTPEEKKAAQREQQQVYQQRMLELRGWWMQRMARGPRPFQEKMVLFWHGHFATSVDKVRNPYYMWRQNELFRRLATSNWLQLLTEAGKDGLIKIRPKAVFLNLDQPSPHSPLTLVIYPSATNQFVNIKSLTGKNVEAQGVIRNYRNQPEIILERTNQLNVIEPIE